MLTWKFASLMSCCSRIPCSVKGYATHWFHAAGTLLATLSILFSTHASCGGMLCHGEFEVLCTMPEIQIVALGLSPVVDRNRFSPRSAERHLCEGGV